MRAARGKEDKSRDHSNQDIPLLRHGNPSGLPGELSANQKLVNRGRSTAVGRRG